MTLTRKAFSQALANELLKGYDPIRLASWAYRLHLDSRNFETGLEREILRIVAMGEGPEFVLPERELRDLVKMLGA